MTSENEIRIFLRTDIRSMEQQLLHQRKAKIMTTVASLLVARKKGILLSTKMTFTLAQYLRTFYVKDRRPLSVIGPL
jgi:hypothetical protein